MTTHASLSGGASSPRGVAGGAFFKPSAFRLLQGGAHGPRLGRLVTPHGEVETPCFMPVGTQGVVKTLTSDDLESLGAQIILSNTYHLHLRPGETLIEKMGGLHEFMSWRRPILTDSGGSQVFSLKGLTRVTDEGVEFRSPHDGTEEFFTPEKVVEIQMRLGSDIAMPLDECTPYPCTEDAARLGGERTLLWLARSKAEAARLGQPGKGRALFGIVQGGTYAALRREFAERTVALGLDGYALGGLSVGEPKSAMAEMIGAAMEKLPADRPRYLMGVGMPEDLWEAVGQGVDMFDCVLPTRNARNGQAFTWDGRLNLDNGEFRDDRSPLDPDCPCPACRRYTRAYLCHLFRAREITPLRLVTLHNLTFLLALLTMMKNAIRNGSFESARREFLARYLHGR